MKQSVFVTGSGGQIGQELLRLQWPTDVSLLTPEVDQLDISHRPSVDDFFANNDVAAIINCAAYTAVDRAEIEISAAYAANAFGPAWLASAAGRADIPIVHVSTDYVFGDGEGRRRPHDPVAPKSVYGASKLAGEIAVTAATDRAVIIRTAWVISPFGSNFLKTMLRLAEKQDEVRVVADQKGCPTAAGDIAEALQSIILRMLAEPQAPAGTYHFVNEGEASWADLASAVMAEAKAAGLPSARIVEISNEEFPTKAKRPTDSRLDCSTLTQDFGTTPRPWREAVKQIVRELAQTIPR